MYCPQCGTLSPDDRKFCTTCGLNLALISDVILHRSRSAKGGSSWPSLMEMIFGKQREPTPEERRLNDIRNGIITMLTGAGITIFLYFLLNAVATRPDVRPEDAPIIRAVALCGVIPFMVGVGLLINGLFFWKLGPKVSPSTVETARESPPSPSLTAGETLRMAPSVTEQTTMPLENQGYESPRTQNR